MAPPPLKAPTADGGLFCRPGAQRLPASLRANELVFDAAAGHALQGRSLSQLRGWARAEALHAAIEYTRDVAGVDVPASTPSGPWIVTGHQPALFHPGVWAKNFAVDALARRHAGTGLNLIVDNDLLASAGIGVPRGPRGGPRIELFPMLDPQPPRPWEEAIVDNARPFDAFGQCVAEAIEHDWGFHPLAADVWDDAVAARDRAPRLSDCLTAVRSHQERRWGLQNVELPLSRLEETAPFRWFAAHILAHAEEFQRVHNAALADYRRQNHIRSQAHPVPELRRRDGWTEAPLWIWRAGESVRHPLFVRSQGKRVEIACDTQQIGKLRLSRETDACCAVEDLAQFAEQGWRIRTRALTTTLFARLCLADLFVHGIGGAKYDEMTDRIIERFYGLTPPVFLTLTATQHLPLQPFAATRDDALAVRRRLRDLDFNPDHVPGAPPLDGFARERDRLVAELDLLRGDHLPGVERRRRRSLARPLYRELQSLRSRQQPALEELRGALRSDLAAVESQLAANRILKSREFAWCLFPEPLLHSLAQRIAANLTAVETAK